PRVSEAGDGAVDQPRVDRGQRVVAEAELVHHARPEVFPDHVRGLHEALHDLEGVGLPEIERDAALVAVHREEAGRHLPLRPLALEELVPRLVAVARLDLDHVRAEQRELVRAVRTGEVAREVEDPDAGEGFRHFRPGMSLIVALTDANSLRFSAMSSGVSFSRLL